MARARPEALQRRAQIALRHLHIADLLVAHREVALPTGIARVRRRQTLADGMARPEARQRRVQSSLRHLHAAYPFVAHREVALGSKVIR